MTINGMCVSAVVLHPGARECPYDDWWLGRTITVADPEFGGKCFRQFTEKETFEDVMFGARDFAITVQWYERNPSAPQRPRSALIRDD
jgi:hypothetical protein